MKSIVKEIVIILLLCIAICTILAIIFYDYIPFNKVVPSDVEKYSTASSIVNEINQEVANYQVQNITLEITNSDLSLYKQSKEYSAGKRNPFATPTTGDSNSTNTTSSNSVSTNSVSNNSNANSTNYFYNSDGLK